MTAPVGESSSASSSLEHSPDQPPIIAGLPADYAWSHGITVRPNPQLASATKSTQHIQSPIGVAQDRRQSQSRQLERVIGARIIGKWPTSNHGLKYGRRLRVGPFSPVRMLKQIARSAAHAREPIQRLSMTCFNFARTFSAAWRNCALSMACMEATGSIAATSVLPPATSCTTTLQGSMVPTLSSNCSASCASAGLHAPKMR